MRANIYNEWASKHMHIKSLSSHTTFCSKNKST